MSYTGKPAKKEKIVLPPDENKKGIDNHLKAAKHLEKAAVLHLAAAKAHEKGRHKKAAKITIKAADHHARAGAHQQQDEAQHALQHQLVM